VGVSIADQGGYYGSKPLPDGDAIAGMAEEAVDSIPEPLRAHLQDIVFRVQEFPDPEAMASVGADDPFDLLGLYHGVSLAERSSFDTAHMPDMIFLYRRPILEYWQQTGESLEHLVRHVLIHEVGHHFGLSDEDMEAIEAMAETDNDG